MMPLKANVVESSFIQEIHRHIKTAFDTEIDFDIKQRPDVFVSTEMNFIDHRILTHIKTHSKRHITATFVIGQNIVVQLHLIYETYKPPEKDILKKASAVAGMLLFLNNYTTLPNQINIFVYLASLKKEVIPGQRLGFYNANTGFTIPNHSDIYIFRKEEWFKVLIHESFHCFGLDFASDLFKMDYNRLYPIKSTFLIYEAYTEFWAEVINIAIYSFLRGANNFAETFKRFLGIEQKFKLLQMTKVLHHMNGLTYADLVSGVRPERFEEDTNIFCYYVLCTVLLCSFDSFVAWCRKHNKKNMLYTEKDENNCRQLYQYFMEHYKDQDLLKAYPLAFGTSLRMTSIEFI